MTTTTSPALNPEVASAVLRAVDNLESELIDLTRSLVACRTDSQSEENPDFAPEAERCQTIVAQWLQYLGAIVERWQTPPRYPVVAGLLEGTGDGRSLAFNGHVDVVPVGHTGAWSHDPWLGEVDAGKLWGRGAADMK